MKALDHLVVAAQSLDEGVAYVEDQLGVLLPNAGGKHPLMGTHNRLLRLGGAYLEVIAIDPQAPAPARPRWFGLDGFSGPPRLLTWVVRVDDLHPYSQKGFGEATQASRGKLEWLIAIPQDGRLHAGGVLPYFIQWGTHHPCDSLLEQGCALERLELTHPQPHPAQWAELGLGDLAQLHTAEAVRLEAHIHTPHGLKSLG